MHLFKKNPVLCIFILLCILVFAGGVYLTLSAKGDVSDAKARVRNEENRLSSALSTDPAPSAENVEASEANVEALRGQLESIRESLQRGSRLTVSNDGVRVTASIQQYISEFQSKTANHTLDGGQAARITTPENFAFGFEQYIDQATVPDDPEVVPVLDKQRQILSYILNQLIDADPRAIERVRREVVERPQTANAERRRGNDRSDSQFQISPAISARVPGAIDTLAFSVTFTGYTDSLRQFLNNLKSFDLPLVVRSVEVQRPTGTSTTSARPTSQNELEQIFGMFGGSSEAGDGAGAEAPASPTVEQKPVISENVSRFTVILEFIEIVLPSESEENPS